MPGLSEWIVILVIILIIFGAGKLPQVGEALGKSIRNFKRSSQLGDEPKPEPAAQAPVETKTETKA